MTDELDALLQRLQDDHNAEYCSYYGEPGYTDPERGIIFCNWNNISKEDQALLEAEGFELEWEDEWTIDYDNNKAYRTSPDSYHWQPSVWWNDDGQMFTPDDDISMWIAEMVDDDRLALPNWITQADLEEAGFELYSDHEETGMHTGMNADPHERTGEIHERYGNDCEVVFRISEVSQFYVVWESWVRRESSEDEDGETDDVYALASAGWGTDEDYGG